MAFCQSELVCSKDSQSESERHVISDEHVLPVLPQKRTKLFTSILFLDTALGDTRSLRKTCFFTTFWSHDGERDQEIF